MLHCLNEQETPTWKEKAFFYLLFVLFISPDILEWGEFVSASWIYVRARAFFARQFLERKENNNKQLIVYEPNFFLQR